MNLYIQVIDGQPVNHPAFEDNLVEVFGSIPPHWEPFVRVGKPVPTIYQTFDSEDSTYQKVNGVWQDVWPLRDMTDAEKTATQQAVKDAWAARPQSQNWSAWTFNETTCQYDPPIPRPVADQTKLGANIHTFWCGVENNWRDTPPHPMDDKPYKFDFIAWNWVPA